MLLMTLFTVLELHGDDFDMHEAFVDENDFEASDDFIYSIRQAEGYGYL